MRPWLSVVIGLVGLGASACGEVPGAWGAAASQEPLAEDASIGVGDDARATTLDVRAEDIGALAAADLTDLEHALAARMRAVADVTVEVDRLVGGELVAHGSGVVVSADGAVLTAGHVTERGLRDPHDPGPAGRLSLRVIFPNGEQRDALVVARDDVHDAALLRAPGAPTAFARVATRSPRAGEWVVCAGHAGAVASDRIPTRSAGVIANAAFAWTVREYTGFRLRELARVQSFWNMLALDCASAPGMSGGPVVGLDGEVLGVVVGTGTVAASIAAIRHLLPRSARDRAPSAAPRAPVEPRRVSNGEPSRAATMDPIFAAPPDETERSILELEPLGPPLPHTLGVVIDPRGLVIAPAATIGVRAADVPSDEGLPCAAVKIVGRPDARCQAIVAVRGELALLRFDDLGAGPASLEASAPELGEMVAATDAHGVVARGFVTALARSPGFTAREPPRWGCGTLQLRFRQEHPGVEVTSALAHDLGMPPEGALLVDRRGRTVALQIGSDAPSKSYAIPWSEVLARFAAWLAPAPLDAVAAEPAPGFELAATP